MKFWVIMASAIAIWSEDNSFSLDDVSTFSPRQQNNVSFIYQTEDECEAGLLSIMQREGGRMVAGNSGEIRLVREDFKEVYDCTEIVITK